MGNQHQKYQDGRDGSSSRYEKEKSGYDAYADSHHSHHPRGPAHVSRMDGELRIWRSKYNPIRSKKKQAMDADLDAWNRKVKEAYQWDMKAKQKTGLSDEDIAIARDIFDMFDLQGRGVLAEEELIIAYRMLTATEGETEEPSGDNWDEAKDEFSAEEWEELKANVHEAFTGMDTDGDMVIDFVEFCQWWKSIVDSANAPEEESEEIKELRDEFNSYDTDGDGHINMAELGAAWGEEGQALLELFQAADTDQNGYIDFNEWVAVMTDA